MKTNLVCADEYYWHCNVEKHVEGWTQHAAFLFVFFSHFEWLKIANTHCLLYCVENAFQVNKFHFHQIFTWCLKMCCVFKQSIFCHRMWELCWTSTILKIENGGYFEHKSMHTFCYLNHFWDFHFCSSSSGLGIWGFLLLNIRRIKLL